MSGRGAKIGSFGGIGNARSYAGVFQDPPRMETTMAGRGEKQGSFEGPGSAASLGGSGHDPQRVQTAPLNEVPGSRQSAPRLPEDGVGGPASQSSSQAFASSGILGHQRASNSSFSLQEGTSQSAVARERSSHVASFPRGGGNSRGGYNASGGRYGDEDASGSGTGRGGRGRRGGGPGGRNAMDPIEALGRCMAAILRHQAGDYNLGMKSDGYVLVCDLLKQSRKTAAGIPLSAHTEDDVRKAVAADGKQRFGLKEEDGELCIRANQGHSIRTVESEHLLKPITDPSEIPVCVHGTYEKFLNSIWEEGLKRMTRNHIHFAPGLPKEDGVISGMRATAQVLIYLDVEKAMQDGMKLYVSDNKVVLTEGFDGVIPAKYFKKVVKKQPQGAPILLFPPPRRQVPNSDEVKTEKEAKADDGGNTSKSARKQ